jgi:competence protein ComEA
MKQIVRDYLTFNKRERNGVFILVAIIALLLIYLNVSENFQEKEKRDVTAFVRELDSIGALEVNDSVRYPALSSAAFSGSDNVKKKAERFDFDPNNLPDEDWKRLGLSDKQVRTIKNYESKGGKFRKKEDLKKMYCIKEDLYVSLEPFIKIIAAQAAFESEKTAIPATEVKTAAPSGNIIELNSADSAILTTIKGIGPFYAKAIIKYRNSLGGFHSKEQLMEVWKFDQEKFDAVKAFIAIDAKLLKKININTCEAEQLKGPYIKWNVANAIVNYRKQHGKFKTIDEIKQTDLVDEELLRKIAPYLVLE